MLGHMKKRLLVLAGIAGAGAVVGLAAPGSAEGNDGVFLSALAGAGLSHNGASQAIAAGHAVCQLLDEGLSPVDTVTAIQGTNPGFTLEHAAQFAAISASAYCPQHM